MRSSWRQIHRGMVVLRWVDAVLIADMPNEESMGALALAITAGGAL